MRLGTHARRWLLVLAIALLAAGTTTATRINADTASVATETPVLLGAEGNRLRAFDLVTLRNQVVRPSHDDDPEDGIDLNAQICEDPNNPHHFIAGEDTGQPERPAGWGYFRLDGSMVGNLSIEQVGKLTPTYQPSGDQPENYGCGFLPDGRLVTTDVGDQQPGTTPNGQLIVWFPPFDSTSVRYCKVDIGIATAGGIHVNKRGNVLVASQRPGLPNTLDNGGVYRYNGNLLPTSDTAAGGCGQTDGTGAPMADPGRVKKSLFIGASPEGVLTPSAIAPRPRGGYYVSSVFTGVIAQYDEDGRFMRRVLTPAVADAVPPYASGTPLGITVGPDGTIYYADLGVVVGPPPGPGDGNGTVRRIRFRDGRPLAPEVLADGLAFPDGVGLVNVTGGPGTATLGTSSWGCGDWGMYGGNHARTFSTECSSAISRGTASTVVPAWTFKTAKTVTASPVVVQGTVYVGDWTGTMYALRLSNGTERWRFQTPRARGAAFGPIVSSAAVADTIVGGQRKRLVIFGSGPLLFALDAENGRPVWTVDLSNGVKDTPTEMLSSPVVYNGRVYIGVDTHNRGVEQTGGVRGGLLVVDAATGAQHFKFEPELDQVGVGCGGVWSSPAIDARRNRVIFATANCGASREEFTWNAHTEAVTALDATTGAVAWTFRPGGRNLLDVDFGATPTVFRGPSGRSLVGIGKKDAFYYVVDANSGRPVWERKVAEPGNVSRGFAIGGFIGSAAVWRNGVFGGTAIGGPPYYHSLKTKNGDVRWVGAGAPTYGASAVVNGVVVNGDLSSVLHLRDAYSGLDLSVQPLLGPASSGPAIAGDTIVVGSGTSSTDACAKELPVNEACLQLFDSVVGATGGVQAFRPLGK